MPKPGPVMRALRRRPASDPALLLLRSVCHELRPPMSTLASLLRALERQPSDARRNELARLAAEHAAHAEAVLEHAAAAAQGLAGPAEPAQPLHRILPMVTHTMPAARLAVSATPAALDCPVLPQHTKQILINLLSNAARHGPPDGTVRLRAWLRRRRLHLTITDQGAPTDDLTAALRRRTPPPGTQGLGLWVVRHLVAVDGGSLRARSRHPEGLEMEVSLPPQRR
jgi:signal transduction histidine kinase